MNRVEFAQVMAYLSAACGKDVPEEMAEVYYDVLQDLPLEALQAAAKLVLAEHRFANFPTIGELREAAQCFLPSNGAPPGEIAYREAMKSVQMFGFAGQAKALARLHPDVAHAVESFGWRALCDSTEPEVCRGQFMRIYESISARRRRLSAMPQALRAQAENLTRFLPSADAPPLRVARDDELPAGTAPPRACAGIGCMPGPPKTDPRSGREILAPADSRNLPAKHMVEKSPFGRQDSSEMSEAQQELQT
jgi:hypothetical protein